MSQDPNQGWPNLPTPPPPGGYYPQARQPDYPEQPGMPGYPPGTLPYGLPMNRRPTSATVLAIIGLCLGILAVLFDLGGLLLIVAAPANLRRDVGPIGWGAADRAVSALLWIVAIIACIGLLRVNAAARKLILAWSVAYMLWLVVWVIGTIMIVVPEFLKNRPNPPPGYEAGAYGGPICGMVILSIYPICNLSLLSKRSVAAAYEDV
jgi:hypothetical protein